MKQKLLLLAVFIMFSLISNAQTDTVRYKEIINDPVNIPNFEFYLTPLDYEISAKDLMIVGFGAGIRGTIADKVKLSGSFYKPYTTKIVDWNNLLSDGAVNQNLENPQNPTITLNQNFKPSYNFELGAGIIISDKIATKKVLINLAQQQTGYVIINTVSSVDTKVRKRTSLRVGYYQYQSLINLISVLSSDNYLLAENGDKLYSDGIGFSNINYSDLESAYSRDYSTYDEKLGLLSWLTNMNVKSGYIGLETEYITNLVVETDKYGKRANQAITKFYGDIFFGKTLVRDFLFFNSNPSATIYGEETGSTITEYSIQTGDGEHELGINKLGLRIGFERFGITPTKFTKWENTNEISRRLNIGYKFEAGILPGAKTNLFAKIGMMLIFNK